MEQVTKLGDVVLLVWNISTGYMKTLVVSDRLLALSVINAPPVTESHMNGVSPFVTQRCSLSSGDLTSESVQRD